MPSLKYVKVDMAGHWWVEPAYEEVLFTPLEAVKGLREFEVTVGWEKDEHLDRQSKGKVWPFVIKRVGYDMMYV